MRKTLPVLRDPQIIFMVYHIPPKYKIGSFQTNTKIDTPEFRMQTTYSYQTSST